jgi:hypothetical protein
VLRRIFGPKRDEVTRVRESCIMRSFRTRTLHSPRIVRIDKSRRMRWGRHLAFMEGKVNAYGLLVGKTNGKRPVGTPRRMWADDIKVDILVIR